MPTARRLIVFFVLACHCAAPTVGVEIISLSPTTLGPNDTALLAWRANVSGHYLLTAVSASGSEHVLARGKMTANVTATFQLTATMLTNGANQLNLIALGAQGHSATARAQLSVGGVTGGTTGGSGSFVLSGSVSGIACGGSVVLSDGLGQQMTVEANGAFQFTTLEAQGENYSVNVVTAPFAESCVVANASGMITADTSNVSVACTTNAGPRLFFTDLDGGPNTGGLNDDGVFVTLYGEGFGPTRGDARVLIGGVEVASYFGWGQDNAPARQLDMIVVQLGASAQAGRQPLVVQVGGQSSNALTFDVRAGRVLFIDPSASAATHGGSIADPFNGFAQAKSSFTPGDIYYLRAGTYSTPDPDETNGERLLLQFGANPEGPPIAMVGYPGESAIITGGADSMGFFLATPTNPIPTSDGQPITIAGLTFSALDNQALRVDIGNALRVIGNQFFSDGGITLQTQDSLFAGNIFTDNTSSAFSLTADNSNLEIGWNEFRRQDGNDTIELDSPAASAVTGWKIHHNYFSGSSGSHIGIFAMPATSTEVALWDNIFEGAYADAVFVEASDVSVQIDARLINNSFYYDNTAGDASGNAEIVQLTSFTGQLTLVNNIVQALIDNDDSIAAFPSAFTGGPNFWRSAVPPFDPNGLTGNPEWVAPGTVPPSPANAFGDFSLQASSPALHTASDDCADAPDDYFGVPRIPGAFDFGAE